MKAVLCKHYGPPETLKMEDVPSLVPGNGQVVVAVHAAGVNFPDTLIIENKYQLKPPLPFSPGGEVAGTVKAVGSGVSRVRPGDRVVATTSFGGFAEEVLVPQSQVMQLPQGADLVAASALLVTYGTSHYALKQRARLQPGESLLVLGAAGGTGLSAVELGSLMGARVIAAASTDDKLALCRERGATETINYSRENLRQRIDALTDGRGVDVVYDPVGGGYSEPTLRGMAWKGRFLVIGFTTGDIPRLPLNIALLKGCSIVGVYYGASVIHEPERSEQNMAELMEWFAGGRVKPFVSATYHLEQAAQALQAVAGRGVKGKIVLVTDLARRHSGADIDPIR